LPGPNFPPKNQRLSLGPNRAVPVPKNRFFDRYDQNANFSAKKPIVALPAARQATIALREKGPEQSLTSALSAKSLHILQSESPVPMACTAKPFRHNE